MRLILAGSDPVATDAICALLTGHDPELVPHLVTLHNDSCGCCDARLIRVDGIRVGDEKKDFGIFDTGILSKYDDFEPPSFSVNACNVEGNQLHISLFVDQDVTRVEVEVDGILLHQIVIGGFDDFSLDLDTLVINPGTQVIIYAYDQYLNYSSEITFPVSIDPGENLSDDQHISVKIAPNPFRDELNIVCYLRGISSATIGIYNAEGRMVKELPLPLHPEGRHVYRCNTGDLLPGVYYCVLTCDKGRQPRRVIKL